MYPYQDDELISNVVADSREKEESELDIEKPDELYEAPPKPFWFKCICVALVISLCLMVASLFLL